MEYRIIATFCEEPPVITGYADSLEEAFEKAATHFEQLKPWEDAVPSFYHAASQDSGEEQWRINPMHSEAMMNRLEKMRGEGGGDAA